MAGKKRGRAPERRVVAASGGVTKGDSERRRGGRGSEAGRGEQRAPSSDLYELVRQKNQRQKGQAGDLWEMARGSGKNQIGPRRRRGGPAQDMGSSGKGKTKTVRAFLASLESGLEKHAQTLEREEVDVGVLRQLTEEDLARIGIPLGARKKIISGLRSESS